MDEMNNRTINGKPITQELLESLSFKCEKDWLPDEVLIVPTNHALALAALQALDLPIEEIEALERRAKHENISLLHFLKAIIRNELAS